MSDRWTLKSLIAGTIIGGVIITSAVTIGADRLLIHDDDARPSITRQEPGWCGGNDRYDPHKCWFDDRINEWRIGVEDEEGPVIK